MARISQSTIELIQNTADIVDVVSDYVSLQPAGKNFKGLCPFHSEKTPSFFVSKERNIFNCFGCHEKGDSIRFIQKYKNISYVEALMQLAEKYHITVETEGEMSFVDRYQRYYQLNEKTSNYYQLNLTNLDKGKKAFDYIQSRGLDVHTIQYFEIGYAPNEMDALYQHLRSEYEPIEMMEIGLIKKNESDYYDLFRDRLMFPIRNEFGKVVGFSGRIYENKPQEAKYVNSPYTKIFTKGDILYNLDKAQPFINREKRIVLYEGFLDVIASFQAGIKEAVCSMGTALTEDQALLIKKYTNHAIVCYDGDDAGFEAISKAIPILQQADLAVSVVLLPEGLDPDEYTKKYGRTTFVRFINETQVDPVEFEYQYLKKRVDLTKPSQVEDLKLKVFLFLLAKDSQMLLEIYTKKLAEDLNVEYDSIKSDLHHFQITRAITKSLSERHEKLPSQVVISKSVRGENRLVQYYMENKAYRQIIIDELGEIFTKDKINTHIIINAQEFFKSVQDKSIKEKVISVFDEKTRDQVRRRLDPLGEQFSQEDLYQLIYTMKISKFENDIIEIKEQADYYRQQGQMAEYKQLHSQIIELKLKIEKLRKESVWKKPKS